MTITSICLGLVPPPFVGMAIPAASIKKVRQERLSYEETELAKPTISKKMVDLYRAAVGRSEFTSNWLRNEFPRRSGGSIYRDVRLLLEQGCIVKTRDVELGGALIPNYTWVEGK